MKCDEIFAALDMLEKERGISPAFMMDKIVQALTTAYKRDHEGVENVIVDVNEAKKDLRMYVQKEIVEEVEFPGTQMSVEEARAKFGRSDVGGLVNIPVDNVEFGRIAAGNGKQVIIQGLREAERGMVYDEFNSKQHEILTGVVTRIDPRNGAVSLRIGTGAESTEAMLSASEQIKGEDLQEGQHVKVYVVEVRRSTRGPQVLISRTHPGLVKRLFELEVPEIFDGTVEVNPSPVRRAAAPRWPCGATTRPWTPSAPAWARRPAGGRHRQRAPGREDRHHQVQRGPRPVHRRRPGPRRRAGRVAGRRGQGLPGHRSRRPAEPGHRQGGAERPPGRPAHRV